MHTDDTQEPLDFQGVELIGLASPPTLNGEPAWSVDVTGHQPDGTYWSNSVTLADKDGTVTPRDIGRAVFRSALGVVASLGPEAHSAFLESFGEGGHRQ